MSVQANPERPGRNVNVGEQACKIWNPPPHTRIYKSPPWTLSAPRWTGLGGRWDARWAGESLYSEISIGESLYMGIPVAASLAGAIPFHGSPSMGITLQGNPYVRRSP